MRKRRGEDGGKKAGGREGGTGEGRTYRIKLSRSSFSLVCKFGKEEVSIRMGGRKRQGKD